MKETLFVIRVTRRMSHVERRLLTLPEHLRSSPVLVGFVLLDLWFSVLCFVDRCLYFVLFLLVIVLSVLLRFTASSHVQNSYMTAAGGRTS